MITENLFKQPIATGETVAIHNVGIGIGIAARRDDLGFALRSIRAGAGIVVKMVGDDVEISNTGDIQQSFLSIAEAPASFTGANGKYLSFNALTGRLEFSTPAPVYGSFKNLTDAPSSYTGLNGYLLTVDETNNRVVWTNVVAANIAPLAARVTAAEAAITALQAKHPVTISETAPTVSVLGDFWYRDSDGALFIRYGTPAAWVEVGASEPAAPVQKTFNYGANFEPTPTASQVIYRWRVPVAHTLLDEFAGCVFGCDTAPSSTFACKVYINGTYLGDWLISAAKNSSLITLNTDIQVPAGAEVKVVAPAVPVTGITGITMSFQGVIQ